MKSQGILQHRQRRGNPEAERGEPVKLRIGESGIDLLKNGSRFPV